MVTHHYPLVSLINVTHMPDLGNTKKEPDSIFFRVTAHMANTTNVDLLLVIIHSSRSVLGKTPSHSRGFVSNRNVNPVLYLIYLNLQISSVGMCVSAVVENVSENSKDKYSVLVIIACADSSISAKSYLVPHSIMNKNSNSHI